MHYLWVKVKCKTCNHPTEIEGNGIGKISICKKPSCDDYFERKVIPKEYYKDITI